MQLPISLIFTLMIMFDNQNNISVHNYTNQQTLVVPTIELAAKELDIENIIIFVSNKQFDNDLMEVNGEASVHLNPDGTYAININQTLLKKEFTIVLLHEMQHIKQMYEHRLKILKHAVWFEGKVYTNSNSEYANRPYERESIEVSLEIYKKYKDYFKSL